MIWLLPILNAAFGWFLISMLIYFLYHPEKKKKFFVAELQGIVPGALPSLIETVSEFAGSIFSFQQLREELLKQEKLDSIQAFLEKKVDSFLRVQLPEKLPILSMFASEGLISKMKEVLMSQLVSMIPEMIEKFSNDLEAKLDIKQQVRIKLMAISTSDLEIKMMEKAGKNILQLKIAAAVAGCLLGLAETLLLLV